MIIQKHNFDTIELTQDETTTVAVVNNILAQFQARYEPNFNIVNQTTGEHICTDELARVRGILDFFKYPYAVIEIQPTEN